MRIQHNIMAMNAYRNYTNNTSAVSKNLEKLSSGYKINRAGDDAAGLAISEKMRAQITGLETAQKNAKDGISLVQTAEGALTEVHDMLNRMVELAGQSANGTYDNDVDRANLQKEVKALKDEINRIAESSNFNGQKLLDGSLSATGGSSAAGVPSVSGMELSDVAATKGNFVSADFVNKTDGVANGKMSMTVNYTDSNGKNQVAKVEFTIDNANSKLVAADGTTYSITATDDIKKGEAQDAFLAELKKTGLADTFKITKSTDALSFEAKQGGANSQINSILSDLAADATTTTETLQTLATNTKGVEAYQNGAVVSGEVFTVGGKKFAIAADQDAAVALGPDVNVVVAAAVDNTSLTNLANLIEQKTGYKPAVNGTAGLSFTAPTGANAVNGKGLTLQIGDTAESFNKLTVSVGDMHCKALGIDGVDISTQEGADAAIGAIKTAINSVSSTRGDLGALQNRLEHTINNLSVMTENIQDAESSIRDVDVAEEMMAYTKNNILVQSAQAMLAQANQIPQGVLQLLQ